MKQLVYFTTCLFSGALFAQFENIPISYPVTTGHYPSKPAPTYTVRADGDMIWQDDFSNPANWNIYSNSGAFVIGDNNHPETSINNSTFGDMASPTASNGFAAFNGTHYLNSNDFGIKNTAVISPTIDLTGFSFVVISFSQRIRKFSMESTFLELSEDGGITWETLTNTSLYNIDQTPLQQTISIATPVSGSFETRIRFRWEGAGYGWYVDDVTISEGYSATIRLDDGFALMGDHQTSVSKIPIHQTGGSAAKLAFQSYIENNGYSTLAISMNASSNTYSFTSAPVNVPSLLRDTLAITLNDGLPLPQTTGPFEVQLSFEATPVLQQLEDDSMVVNLEITDHVFAVDQCDGTASTMDGLFLSWINPIGEQAVGAMYHILEDMTVETIGIGIAPIPAQDQSLYTGNTFKGKLMIFNPATGEVEYLGESISHVLQGNDYGTIIELPTGGIPVSAGSLILALADRPADQSVPFAFSGSVKKGTVYGLDGGELVLMGAPVGSSRVGAPVVRLNTQSPCELSDTVTVNAYQQPSDANSCNGLLSFLPNGVPNFQVTIDAEPTFTTSGSHQVYNLCPGVHTMTVSDFCNHTTTVNFVIPTDSNYIFNNLFIDSIAVDSLGQTIENCDIYYNGIDTAYIDSIWANANTVHVVWTIVDSNGAATDTSSYVLNNGNGVYYLQLSVFCPNRAIGDYFTVSEAVYFANGQVISTVNTDELTLVANLNIYPNPTNNAVTVVMTGAETVQLTITDAQGKLVATDVVEGQKTIDLESFGAGVYLFRLSSLRGTTVKRVVKK